VAASWGGVMPAKRATEQWYYTHNICWHTDPDVVCVRPPLTLGQARVWACMVGLTGQLLMFSDKMYELQEDRVELIRRITPVMPLVSMEFYPLGEDQLDVICAKIWKGFRHWDVAGFFNWTRKDKIVRASIDDLGLRKEEFLVYDYFNDKFLGVVFDEVAVSVPKQDCRILSLTPFYNALPVLMGTSRHITMGGVDLLNFKTDQNNKAILGESGNLVPGEPYTLVFYIYNKETRIVDAIAENAEVSIKSDGRIARVTFVPEKTWLSWKILYKDFEERKGRYECASLAFDKVGEITSHSIAFSWKFEGDDIPKACVISRDKTPIATVVGNEWIDSGLESGKTYDYTVSVLPFRNQSAPKTAFINKTLTTTTPPPPPPEPSVYLSDLKPVSATQGWGKLGLDKSTDGNVLTIGGEKFKKGLGTHAESAIEYEIDEEYEAFSAYVGVDQETGNGTVSFELWLDGEKAYESPVVYNGDLPLGICISVKGKKRIRLVVTNGGDNIHYDHADWARAGFVLNK